MKNNAQDNRNREVAYPLYDLAEAFKVAEAVRDLGGGNAPVSKSLLAQQLKYAETGPSFFQRVAAAKSFGLIDGWGSYSLTDQAKQYFYPTAENGKESAAVAILTFPNAFAVLVQKFDGGKLPANEMIGNIIHKEAAIPVSKKDVVASCFVRSAQFLKVIDASGFLRCKAFVASGNRAGGNLPPGDIKLPAGVPEVFTLEDTYTFYLDGEKQKKVSINAPFRMTEAEYQRICTCIKSHFIIDKPEKETQ
jgi:hypothetical protein